MKPAYPHWLAALSALALVACDGGASAVPARDHSAAVAVEQTVDFREEPRDAPLIDGKPMWSSNAKYSAEENAAYHFERDGAEFGAKTLDAFVEKAHAFVSDPPKGALTLTRANGDKLIYDPDANIFAVATKDGAPRTMFKPDDGMAYWEKQKARESRQADGGSRDDRG
jgi:pyocin large subunit-like protein